MRKPRLWIGGRWQDSQSLCTLKNPYSGNGVAEIPQADSSQVEVALASAEESFKQYRKLSRYTRSKLLSLMTEKIAKVRSEFISLMVEEAGKPYGLSDGEVSRALVTFQLSAEEARRQVGEIAPVDHDLAGRAYAPARIEWVPRGPVLAITPFNFPLNLAAHKVAPALAAGCSVILKPPPQAPSASFLLAQIFEEAAKEASDSREQVPLGTFQVLQCSNELAEKMVTDPRIMTFSFTGSDTVGLKLQGKAIGKKVALELGGNAAVIVHSDADIQRAAARCAFGAFAYAGQVCISVQRIYVHRSVADQFESALIEETRKLGVGDPALKDTLVGPLIDGRATERVLSWIAEAKSHGAKELLGGQKGALITPTILKGVRPTDAVSCQEVFGPVVTLGTYEEFDEAIERVNDSRFGLQAGVFSNNHALLRAACADLEVGGVILNEVPTYRADSMPYGGIKNSGLGREGVRYAMEDYCERKTVVEWLG